MRFLFNKYYFDNPLEIISCRKLAGVKPAFARLEKALASGNYLAGFLSYEAGYAFEECFFNKKTYDFPLVYFGVFRPHPLTLNLPPSPSTMERGMNSPKSRRYVGTKEKKGVRKGVRIGSYKQALSKIKLLLSAGETYQVNYTFKLKFDYRGPAGELFETLRRKQNTPYSGLIETDDFAILSLSPELFFEKRGGRIRMKPMKGTIGLGKGNAHRLKHDPKNQSENVMIVDLLRNDLGRIAAPGTVKAPKFFEVEKHPTLYQMTSTVEAEIPADIPLYPLFRNLFPSGSVTGAPKIRSMQIIRELEKEERKIYCGAIGVITPQRNMLFNVAIRTILLTTSDFGLWTHNGELGIGSGVTFDSDPKKEYEECLLKARFLLGG